MIFLELHTPDGDTLHVRVDLIAAYKDGGANNRYIALATGENLAVKESWADIERKLQELARSQQAAQRASLMALRG